MLQPANKRGAERGLVKEDRSITMAIVSIKKLLISNKQIDKQYLIL